MTLETTTIKVEDIRPGYRYWSVRPGAEHAWTIKSVEFKLAEYQVDRGQGFVTPGLVLVTRNDGDVRTFERGEDLAIQGPFPAAAADAEPTATPVPRAVRELTGTYAAALAATRSKATARLSDAELMALLLETSAQHLLGAVSAQLLWEGAQKAALSTTALNTLIHTDPDAARNLMWL